SSGNRSATRDSRFSPGIAPSQIGFTADDYFRYPGRQVGAVRASAAVRGPVFEVSAPRGHIGRFGTAGGATQTRRTPKFLALGCLIQVRRPAPLARVFSLIKLTLSPRHGAAYANVGFRGPYVTR